MIPVVLAPGLLCDDRLWSAVTPLLAGPVMTVDFAEDDTIEAMAERILAEGPSRFVLAGFSMGGMAAVVAAARAPERIVGLVLIDTHAEPETPDRSERRARQIATASATTASKAAASKTGSSPSRANRPSATTAGRGRLPTWVVRMRSVEVFMRAPADDTGR